MPLRTRRSDLSHSLLFGPVVMDTKAPGVEAEISLRTPTATMRCPQSTVYCLEVCMIDSAQVISYLPYNSSWKMVWYVEDQLSDRLEDRWRMWCFDFG